MSLKIPNESIARLHAAYELSTGLQLPLNTAFAREYQWSLWLGAGFTESDLRLVCAHLRREYPRYAVKMMRFSRLVGDLESFSEWLAEARAMQKNTPPPRTTRQAVLAAVHRHEPTPATQDCAQRIGDVIERNKALWEHHKKQNGLV